MIIYGKGTLKSRLDSTAKKGRLSHAIMFSGESGAGKRTMARYTAQLFLCENFACGVCPICRNIENDNHPDVVFVKQAMPDGKYSAKPFRQVLKDTVIRPNNGEYKVYIFEDCDDMLPVLHNTLLKLIEEPPAHLKFIFTAQNTSVVPETVMSRVTEYEVPATDISDCVKALADIGVDNRKATELAELFSGNIARCKELLADDQGEKSSQLAIIDSAKRAAAALANRDKFAVAAALSQQTNRAAAAEMFRVLSHILRDAIAIKSGEQPQYLASELSAGIAKAYSLKQLLEMLECTFEVEQNTAYNLNLALTVAYFTSHISLERN